MGENGRRKECEEIRKEVEAKKVDEVEGATIEIKEQSMEDKVSQFDTTVIEVTKVNSKVLGPETPLWMEVATPNRRICQYPGCDKGEDKGAYKTNENLTSKELILDDMNVHYWHWPQHDIGNESEWSQIRKASRIR